MSYGTPASASSTFSCPGIRPATGCTATATSLPLARSRVIRSDMAYCAFDTARPYPGTTSTLLASARSRAAEAASLTTHSPRTGSHSSAPSTPAAGRVYVFFRRVPLMPSRTPTMDRFIATHMICERIQPDAPISAPTTVRSWLPSTKPSAASAQPEEELSTVITTGVSAPPMARVACVPRNAPSTATPARAVTASPDAPAAAARKKAAPVATDPATAAPFTTPLNGSDTSLEGTRPFSLAKATTEPVKVTAPMKTPNQVAPRCAAPVQLGCVAYATTEVRVAASPTSEWNAATSWGRSVMAHLAAMARPRMPPAPSAPAACASTPAGAVASRGPAVAASPRTTPAAPSAFPVRADLCEDSMEMAPTQHSADASATVWCVAAAAAPAAARGR
mmetsp:Transcript_23588/g.58468  ORF Transcript_23588/g.58468 Transcript_23588/m.58468 type:complete len:392 (-) Transcript_23588:343-1518(-)